MRYTEVCQVARKATLLEYAYSKGTHAATAISILQQLIVVRRKK